MRVKAIVVLLFCLIISACSSTDSSKASKTEITEGYSEEMFSYGEEVLDITQKFVDGTINKNSAYQKISKVEKKARELSISEKAAEKKNGKDASVKNDEQISENISTIRECVGDDNTPLLIDSLEGLNNLMYPSEENNEELTLAQRLVGDWRYDQNDGTIGYWTFNPDGTFHGKEYNANGEYLSEFDSSYYVDEEKQFIYKVLDDGTYYEDIPLIKISDFTGDSFYSEYLDMVSSRFDPSKNDGIFTRIE